MHRKPHLLYKFAIMQLEMRFHLQSTKSRARLCEIEAGISGPGNFLGSHFSPFFFVFVTSFVGEYPKLGFIGLDWSSSVHGVGLKSP